MGETLTWRDTAAPDASAAMQGLSTAGNQITAAGNALNKGLGDWDAGTKGQATDMLARAAASYPDAASLKAAQADGSFYAKAGIDPTSGWITADGLKNVSGQATTLLNQATTQQELNQNTLMNPERLKALQATTQKQSIENDIANGTKATKIIADNATNTQVPTGIEQKNSDWKATDALNKQHVLADSVVGDLVKENSNWQDTSAALMNYKPKPEDEEKWDGAARLEAVGKLAAAYHAAHPDATDIPLPGQGQSGSAPSALIASASTAGKGGQAGGAPGQAIPPPPMPGTTPNGSGAGSASAIAMAAAIPFPETRQYVAKVIVPGGDNSSDAVWHRMIGQESSGGHQFDRNGNPLTSPKGAVGAAQVMKGTGPEAAAAAGVPWDENKWATDKDYNLKIGRAYFDKQVKHYGGDTAQAAAAYNAGPHAVDGWALKGPHQQQVSDIAGVQHNLGVIQQQNNSGGIQGQYAVTQNNTTMSKQEAAQKVLDDGGTNLQNLDKGKVQDAFNDIQERYKELGGKVPLTNATVGAVLSDNAKRRQHILARLAFGAYDGLSINHDSMDEQLRSIANGQADKLTQQNDQVSAYSGQLQTASNAATQYYNDYQKALRDVHAGNTELSAKLPAMKERYQTAFALSQSLLDKAKAQQVPVIDKKTGQHLLDKEGNPRYKNLPNAFSASFKNLNEDDGQPINTGLANIGR